MKTMTMLLMAFAVLLSGCVVYDQPYRDAGMPRGGDREHERDRDHDRDREHDRGRGRDGARDGDRDGADRMDRRPFDRERN